MKDQFAIVLGSLLAYMHSSFNKIAASIVVSSYNFR